MTDEEMKALSEQADAPQAKASGKKAKKTVKIDEALRNRATGATGYRAFYRQMMKDKGRK